MDGPDDFVPHECLGCVCRRGRRDEFFFFFFFKGPHSYPSSQIIPSTARPFSPALAAAAITMGEGRGVRRGGDTPRWCLWKEEEEENGELACCFPGNKDVVPRSVPFPKVGLGKGGEVGLSFPPSLLSFSPSAQGLTRWEIVVYGTTARTFHGFPPPLWRRKEDARLCRPSKIRKISQRRSWQISPSSSHPATPYSAPPAHLLSSPA